MSEPDDAPDVPDVDAHDECDDAAELQTLLQLPGALTIAACAHLFLACC
jgi:hypothetical protein